MVSAMEPSAINLQTPGTIAAEIKRLRAENAALKSRVERLNERVALAEASARHAWKFTRGMYGTTHLRSASNA